MKRKIIYFLVTLLILLLCNCSSPPKTGDTTYEEIVEAYNYGWNNACSEVFSDYDELYYGGDSYNYYDYIDQYDYPDSIDPTYPDTEYPYLSRVS